MHKPMVEQRLDRLERENCRLKQAGVVALAVIGAVVLMGQVYSTTRIVVADEFLLSDVNGKPRARLGFAPDGTLALTLFDSTPMPRSILALTGDGRPHLQFNDGSGQLRAGLGLTQDNTVLLDLHGGGQRRVSLAVDSNGVGVIVLLDKAGKVIWRAP